VIRLVCPFCRTPWATDEVGIWDELVEEQEICPQCAEEWHPVGDEAP